MPRFAVKEVILNVSAKKGQTRLRSCLAALASVPPLLSFLADITCSPSASLSQFPAKRVLTRNDRKGSVSTLDRSIPLPNTVSLNNLRDESRMGCELSELNVPSGVLPVGLAEFALEELA